MSTLPKAKLENIVEQDLNDELLIYNRTTHKAFSLNQTSKIVFNHCNGVTTFDELKRKYKFTDDLIHLALDELKANDLLENYESNHFGNLSRREIIKRVGLVCAVALPVIAGITAPSAASAASGSTCSDQSNNIDPENGAITRGSGCLCRVSETGRFQPCNTTRGGRPDPTVGCQPGCLCRYSGTAAQCFQGEVCRGVCG